MMYSNNHFLDGYYLRGISYTCSNVALGQTATGPSTICSGSHITLQCVILFHGKTRPSVWTRNGTLVVMNVPSNHQLIYNGDFTDLLITNVGLDDDNTEYQCTATGSDIAYWY